MKFASSPTGGLFYIKNLRTKEYVAASTSLQAGDIVTTAAVSSAGKFSVQKTDGGNTISSYEYALYVGADIQQIVEDKPMVVWSRSEYRWTFFEHSPGVWIISIPSENSFWCNQADDGAEHQVVLRERKLNDYFNWQLIAV